MSTTGFTCILDCGVTKLREEDKISYGEAKGHDDGWSDEAAHLMRVPAVPSL